MVFAEYRIRKKAAGSRVDGRYWREIWEGKWRV